MKNNQFTVIDLIKLAISYCRNNKGNNEFWNLLIQQLIHNIEAINSKDLLIIIKQLTYAEIDSKLFFSKLILELLKRQEEFDIRSFAFIMKNCLSKIQIDQSKFIELSRILISKIKEKQEISKDLESNLKFLFQIFNSEQMQNFSEMINTEKIHGLKELLGSIGKKNIWTSKLKS